MVALAEHLAALVVGDPGNAVEHQADQRLDPLHIAPVVGASFDVEQAGPRPEREQHDVVEVDRRVEVAPVAGLGEGAHRGVVRVDPAVDVAVHRREVGRRGGGVQADLVGELGAVVARPREVVKELRLPAAPALVRVLIVEIEGGHQDPRVELAEGGFGAEHALEDPPHRRRVVVGAAQLAEVEQVVEPRVVEDLRPVVDVEAADLLEAEAAGDAEGQQPAGGGARDEVEPVEEALEARGRGQALHHDRGHEAADAAAVDGEHSVLRHVTPPAIRRPPADELQFVLLLQRLRFTDPWYRLRPCAHREIRGRGMGRFRISDFGFRIFTPRPESAPLRIHTLVRGRSRAYMLI